MTEKTYIVILYCRSHQGHVFVESSAFSSIVNTVIALHVLIFPEIWSSLFDRISFFSFSFLKSFLLKHFDAENYKSEIMRRARGVGNRAEQRHTMVEKTERVVRIEGEKLRKGVKICTSPFADRKSVSRESSTCIHNASQPINRKR